MCDEVPLPPLMKMRLLVEEESPAVSTSARQLVRATKGSDAASSIVRLQGLGASAC